jgi:putative nucleotidyltransferase-like protein
MAANLQGAIRYMDVLSRVVLRGYAGDFNAPLQNLEPFYADVEYLSGLSDEEFGEFLVLANDHHVTIRALKVIQQAATTLDNAKVVARCNKALIAERSRIAHAIERLAPVCQALEAAGAKVTVIKSLDHLPDLGSDLDLYTSGDEQTVQRVMSSEFHAEREPRSWGDRLANKWNFKIPDLPELIEIHVQYLGQTGEHKAMARRVIERSVIRMVNGKSFQVPAPEERVIISTLQRIYRHFYFRLCDMAEVAALLDDGAINFSELRRAANAGGVWPGVATFLLLVSEYVKAYGGSVEIPEDVLADAYSSGMRVRFRAGFLRVPLGPAAGLYGSQLLNAGRHRDLRAMCRLPLLPPLAVSAVVAYRLTGSDKGVW